MQPSFRFNVSGMGGFGRRKPPKVVLLSIQGHSSAVRTCLVRDAKKACFVGRQRGTLVLAIYRVGHKPEVCNPVIGSVAVDVVYIPIRPDSEVNQPSKAMPLAHHPTEVHLHIAMDINGLRLFSDPQGVP
jgi:hypothetical protein